MDAFDLDIRRHVYFSIVANGRPPTVWESARAFDVPEGDVTAASERLHDAHARVLFPERRTSGWRIPSASGRLHTA